MDYIWSPWRSQYIQGFKEEGKNGAKPCFFCSAMNNPETDKEMLVVARREKCFVMLNRYPYNSGHSLIAPFRHVGELDELTTEELINMILTVRETASVLTEYAKPHGFNIGVNVGRVSGAGVPGHFHFHVVPRWIGDTSFMPVLSEIRVVSQAVDDMQIHLSELFAKKRH